MADATKSSFCSVYDISNDITSIKFGLETNFFNLVPGQINFEEKRKRYLEAKELINKKLNIKTQDDEVEAYIKLLYESDLEKEERTIPNGRLGMKFLIRLH